jgi:hypothetical protein
MFVEKTMNRKKNRKKILRQHDKKNESKIFFPFRASFTQSFINSEESGRMKKTFKLFALLAENMMNYLSSHLKKRKKLFFNNARRNFLIFLYRKQKKSFFVIAFMR